VDNEIVDFSEPWRRARVQEYVETLRGRHRVSICPFRPRRSDRQLRYYWPAFVQPLARWLCENWGEPHEPEDAHEILKGRFLRVERVDRRTGEVFLRVGSTGDLDTARFNRYLDDCANFLAEYCGIEVPPPHLYHERDDRTAAARPKPRR
jgi:hypothetical protein